MARQSTENTFASLRVYEHMKDLKTIGIINDDKVKKSWMWGYSLGVITALVPSTNPTSTIIYKTPIALKAGNAIIFHRTLMRNSVVSARQKLSKSRTRSGAPEELLMV